MLRFSISSLCSYPQFWKHFEMKLFNYYFVSMVHTQKDSTIHSNCLEMNVRHSSHPLSRWSLNGIFVLILFFNQIPCLWEEIDFDHVAGWAENGIYKTLGEATEI